MTPEFINRLFAAMMGKCVHNEYNWNPLQYYFECVDCGYVSETNAHWSPSSDGEITKEVRDMMQKELPEWWEKYLEEGYNRSEYFVECLKWTLSISNLARYIVENYKGMFSFKCYRYAPNCGGTFRCSAGLKFPECENGLIVKDEWVEAVKVIENEQA